MERYTIMQSSDPGESGVYDGQTLVIGWYELWKKFHLDVYALFHWSQEGLANLIEKSRNGR